MAEAKTLLKPGYVPYGSEMYRVTAMNATEPIEIHRVRPATPWLPDPIIFFCIRCLLWW